MTSQQRTRSQNEIGTTGTEKRYVNGNETHSSTMSMYSVQDQMVDYVTPEFHKLSAAGEIVNNPMSRVKVTTKSTGGGLFDVTQSGTRYEAKGSGSMTAFLAELLGSNQYGYLPEITPPTNASSRSKAQAFGNLDRSPYAFAEDVGEIRETLNFLRNPMSSLRDLSDDFRGYVTNAQKRNRALSRAKAIANAWTEYRFALSPLLRSVHDAIEASQTKINRPKRRTARGKVEFQDVVTDTLKYIGGAYVFSSQSSIEGSSRAGILYEVSNPINDWKYKYGLRFKDIPETVWALLPYSFMVDRMVNISQSLRGLTSFLDPNVKILAAWETTKFTTLRTRSFIDYDYSAGVTSKTIIPDTDIIENYVTERTVWEPSISDLFPHVEVLGLIDSSTKIADLAALIVQQLK